MTRPALYLTNVFWFQLRLFLLPILVVEAKKRLVLFAGPHGAASNSVPTFFYNHASGAEGREIAAGLEGWKWPMVEADVHADGRSMEKSSIFDALITQTDNSTTQGILLEALFQAWNSSEKGIIVGTPEFDIVDDTFSTLTDGLQAMTKVIGFLQVPPEDVTVVLNYLAPRREQWLSIWRHEDTTGKHYKRFICNNDEDKLHRLLDTSMNPLGLAMEYRKESWNVVLMDMSGVDAMGHDISHAIACTVLDGTNCEGGFLVPVTATYEDAFENLTLASFDQSERDEMDQLFRERDCYYEQFLKGDSGFKILYKDTIWQGCLHDFQDERNYEQLDRPEVLLGAIQSQKRCSRNGANKIETILVSDDYASMTKSTIFLKDSSDSPKTKHIAWSIPLLVIVSLCLGAYYVKKIRPYRLESSSGRREMKGMGGGNLQAYRDEPYDISLDASLPMDHGEIM